MDNLAQKEVLVRLRYQDGIDAVPDWLTQQLEGQASLCIPGFNVVGVEVRERKGTGGLTPLEAHEKMIVQALRNGRRVHTYLTPCCGNKIDTLRPPKNDAWTNLIQCAYCSGLYHLTVTYNSTLPRAVPKEPA